VQDLTKRKSKLEFLTPLLERGKPMVVRVEAWGLTLRLKKERHTLEVTWAQIFNRAAISAAEKARAEKKSR
jgi:hypothetical protein